ncbi:MAG: choice-of-anchor J domain-containing protein [Muribaculum sp.]|nr:choice-of-anchor J domain-containing protein [Muribaculum sp.]
MKTRNLVIPALTALFLAASASVNAQNPVFTKLNDRTHGGSLERLSDNGKWAVGWGKSPVDEMAYSTPRLYNVETKKVTYLFDKGEENTVASMTANDVSDDGQTVVGNYNGKPAVWKASTGKWTLLPYSQSTLYGSGTCQFVTPDGKFAVGTVDGSDKGSYNETIRMWDLSGATPKDITPSNLPKPISLDGNLQSIQQIRAQGISPDGSKFIGLVCFSYVGECWNFVYDRNLGDWYGIGFDVAENTKGGYTFTPDATGYIFTEEAEFMPGNDNMIYGSIYTYNDTYGAFKFDCTTRDIQIIPESEGMFYGTVDANGVVYASTPTDSPLRNWMFRVGNYWYDFKIAARQLWNVDWMNDIVKDEYGFSGTFKTIADNALVGIANDYSSTPYDTYILEFPTPLSEVASKVSLLDNYYVTPLNGASFALLREVRVTFDRNIEIKGSASCVKVLDKDGNTVANSINVAVDPNAPTTALITFRNRRLDVGETYKVVLPAGAVCIKGDPAQINSEISVSYKGRPSSPVTATRIYPSDGAKVESINANSNPVAVTFDSDLSAVDGRDKGSMNLYLINPDNDSRELICQLSGSITGNVLSIYPVLEQRLARGSKYQIVIGANTVADISGADPNEEIVINYEGAYMPKGDQEVLFEDDFNSGLGNNWMFYCGNEQEPAEDVKGWDFVAGLPWWVVRDNIQDTDMAAASHSMYASPDQSDDWMVTGQLNVIDDTAVLTFDSQSYKKNKQDRLKVIVLEDDNIYTALTPSIVDKFRYQGDVVYDEIESPGELEQTMKGEFKHNSIKLDKYAGKNIYVAFWNQNRNQSAIFIDNVLIKRDVKFTIGNFTPQSVVNKNEVEVKGVLTVASETDTYHGYSIKLIDKDGKTVSEIADSNVTASKGWELEFAFDKPLPLTVGEAVPYTIEVTMGDVTDRSNFSVYDLAVETTKKVVIEEFTGQGCPNCPLGHAALETIEKDFPGLVIPLAIHTYTGDPFATPKANSLTQFLGLNAAPTARVNRQPASSPMMITDKGEYADRNAGVWYDQVVAELQNLPAANITITDASYNAADNKYTAKVDVTYALNMRDVQANIFTVVTEDGLAGTQDNNRANETAPQLGEWGKGGKYGQASVSYVYDDVVKTWEGTTCNGTGGYIPDTVEAGKVYSATIEIPNISRITNPKNTGITVMLIDAPTGLVINANSLKVGESSGVEGVEAELEGVSVFAENGTIRVFADGNVAADVYSIDGAKIASANGRDDLSLNAPAGVAVVVVKTDNGTKAYKLIVK